jgi:hypothetical protein
VNEQSNKSLNVALTGSSLGSYRIGLWSYCREETSLGAVGTSNCAPPSRDFWFNPLDVWTLEDPSLQKTLADDLSPGLKAYRRAVVFIKAAFILATVLTVAELFAIFFAIVTRAASAVGLVLSLVSHQSHIHAGGDSVLTSRPPSSSHWRLLRPRPSHMER